MRTPAFPGAGDRRPPRNSWPTGVAWAVLEIRSESRADVAAVRAVHLAAFATPAEADLVDAIRAGPYALPRFSVVAVREGRVVGHALMSHAQLVHHEVERPVLVLAPLAVLPDERHRGTGTALMHECIGRADHAGEPLLLLVGHLGYYPRFGFVLAGRYGVRPPAPLSDAVLLARRLSGYRPAWRGQLRYPAFFEGVMADMERPPAPQLTI